jgi:hypothetical protein
VGHSTGRCNVCKVVEPLGFRHLPIIPRPSSHTVTINGDGIHDLAERLWAKIAGPWYSTAGHEITREMCWPWIADARSGGKVKVRGQRKPVVVKPHYGRIWGGRGVGTIGPHRAVLLVMDRMEYDDPPCREGLFACHRCDTPLCCNPAHLYWGTCQQNTDDMVARGRASWQRPAYSQAEAMEEAAELEAAVG